MDFAMTIPQRGSAMGADDRGLAPVVSGPHLIDSHVHLWDPTQLAYRWLASTELDRRFGVDDLLTATMGDVSSLVVVQGDCLPEQGLAEVEWITGQLRAHGAVGGIVAFAPVELGRDVRPIYQQLRTMPHVVGVRRLLQDERPGFALEPQFLTGLELLGEIALPFDICVRASQLSEVVDMVRRLPAVDFVLDHLGKPRVGAADDRWRDDLSALAQQLNVVCKLSGLSTETDGRPWTAELVRPYLIHAIDVFGPSRCLFGSDWPVLTTAASYQQWSAAVFDALLGRTDVEVAQVMSGNARSVYRLSDLAEHEMR
jgi:L-fuconolactonase